MDEPASALDPIATMKIEELTTAVPGSDDRDRHNMLPRVSDYTAFSVPMKVALVRWLNWPTTQILATHPCTRDYVEGRFAEVFPP